ncbi:thioredoxin domain-containing protein [Demequina sp. NBRC 110057]|uniref:DsbA family protein n=1 Tax=Demequina sp. NBRC 110057 TaxID=1570346 RepID=UPI000A075DC9|nr:thioredoxin domain-containing protein [Demequina sp. NBRC 110057]
MPAHPASASAPRRRAPILIALGAIVAVILGVGIYAFASTADSAVPEAQASTLPEGVDADGGITLGVDGAVGTEAATDVPTVELYFDFACSHCATFEEEVVPELEELLSAGEIAIVQHPVAILDGYFESAYSSRAAAAAMAVAESDPQAYTAFVAALMAAQSDMGSDGFTDAQIADIAADAGVSQEGQTAIEGTDYEDIAVAATEAAVSDGLTGTPSVAIDGEFLDYNEINYMEPGVLVDYLATLG